MPTERNTSLAGCTVLVTRPQHQSAELCALIAAAGGESIHFPVLDIVPVEDSEATTTIIEQLDDDDIAIFISANAVEQGVARVRQRLGRWPDHLQLAVVGRGSARALMDVGLQPDICPEQGFNSEALLALPALQRLQGKAIVIFRGQGGREKLAAVLRQRGARVTYAEVYSRRRADVSLAPLQQRGQLARIQAIIVASNESLQNLYDIAGTEYRDWLLQTPLAVISHRSAELAERLGFRRCYTASEASNEALFEAVRRCVGVATPGE